VPRAVSFEGQGRLREHVEVREHRVVAVPAVVVEHPQLLAGKVEEHLVLLQRHLGLVVGRGRGFVPGHRLLPLLLDHRHRVRALLDARRRLAERVPDVRAPQAQVDVRGRVPCGADGRGRGRGCGRGGAMGGRGSGGKEGQARLSLEAGGLPLRHVARGGATGGRAGRGRGEAHPAQLLLEVRVPVVLDLVVRPAGQLRRDHGPPDQLPQNKQTPGVNQH
jgi:hypothetical protein